jgi:stage II sporulation protein D
MKNLLSVAALFVLIPLLLTFAFYRGGGISWKKEETKEMLVQLLYREALPDSEPEALKAQAILLRSTLQLYTAEEWAELLAESTSLEQEKDFIQKKATYGEAVEQTASLVLTKEGVIQRGIYHEISAGSTRDGAQFSGTVYETLQGVDSSWDTQAESYRQVISLSKEDLLHRFFSGQEEVQLQVVKKDTAGYATLVQWGDTWLSGEEVREKLSLPSSCFTVEEQDGQWVFTCYGVGHGLGMSLYGANAMAKEGKSYEEILQYYFPGYDISSI